MGSIVVVRGVRIKERLYRSVLNVSEGEGKVQVSRRGQGRGVALRAGWRLACDRQCMRAYISRCSAGLDFLRHATIHADAPLTLNNAIYNMADEDRVEQFPDVVQKLSAPKKLSKFEQEKKDADAKRRKEEEENAAALREFEESFAQDEDEDDMLSRTMGGRGSRGPSSGARGGAGGLGGGARYQAPRSGPGSLPGPPMSLKRKREIEEAREAAEARRAELGYDDAEDYHQGMSPAAAQEDDRDDVTPKPQCNFRPSHPARA
jgi:hypothetical protein